jgi:thiol-disulfide isomerase/thioredoxin
VETAADASAGGEPAGRGRRRGRRASLLLLVLLVAGAAAFQYFGRGSADSGALRFAVQVEPRALPPLRFLDGEGRPADLAQLRGKVVLLNIWATWCAPCVREMPSLDRLQALLGAEGLHVLALSIDKGAPALPAVQAFYASHGLRHLRVYNDPEGDAGFDLGVPGVPVTLLLDRQGRELGRVTGAAEWDSEEAVALVRRHLAKPAP